MARKRASVTSTRINARSNSTRLRAARGEGMEFGQQNIGSLSASVLPSPSRQEPSKINIDPPPSFPPLLNGRSRVKPRRVSNLLDPRLVPQIYPTNYRLITGGGGRGQGRPGEPRRAPRGWRGKGGRRAKARASEDTAGAIKTSNGN